MIRSTRLFTGDPRPLFNTALNLVSGNELAWQDRKAESFTLTPFTAAAKAPGTGIDDPEHRPHS